jgi:hypothetical protein
MTCSLSRRESDSVFRGADMPILEWKVLKGRAIVWSKSGGASAGAGSTSKQTYRAVTPRGHGTRVWKERAATTNPGNDESKGKEDTVVIGTVPCKVPGGS